MHSLVIANFTSNKISTNLSDVSNMLKSCVHVPIPVALLSYLT